MKTYKSRSSATEVLRKMGISKHDYNDFVTKTDAGFVVDVEKAKSSVTKTSTQGTTVSSVARKLILKGMANAAVWSKLQAQFGLDDGKRGYPAWYRSELRRKGLLAA